MCACAWHLATSQNPPASQCAAQTDYEPDERSRPEQATEPVDPSHQLLPRPRGEADDEDCAADIVRGPAGRGGESPTREGDDERRVRELRDGKASRPTDLAATPKLGGAHTDTLSA